MFPSSTSWITPFVNKHCYSTVLAFPTLQISVCPYCPKARQRDAEVGVITLALQTHPSYLEKNLTFPTMMERRTGLNVLFLSLCFAPTLHPQCLDHNESEIWGLSRGFNWLLEMSIGCACFFAMATYLNRWVVFFFKKKEKITKEIPKANKHSMSRTLDHVFKKGQFRLYLLRQLRSFNICGTISEDVLWVCGPPGAPSSAGAVDWERGTPTDTSSRKLARWWRWAQLSGRGVGEEECPSLPLHKELMSLRSLFSNRLIHPDWKTKLSNTGSHSCLLPSDCSTLQPTHHIHTTHTYNTGKKCLLCVLVIVVLFSY